MVNHKFNKYGFKEQDSFNGLIPKLMGLLGEDCCEGASDVNVSIFDPTANGNDAMKTVCPQDIMSQTVPPVPPVPPTPAELTGISFENLTWETDVPADGGIANKDNCSFVINALYDDGTVEDVTADATVEGELEVEKTFNTERHEAGELALTATYDEFTAEASVVAYQEAGQPAEEESDSYDYVFDEDSWNESEANGALKKYHEKYPEEDWWNNAADRACNYNDRLYKGTLDSEEVQAGVEWASEAAQKLTINGDVYYGAIFYGFVPQDVELFNDVDLTEPVGKTLLISEITYNENCSRCWKGAINNPGAKYPWVCPIFDTDVNAKVVFRYEGADDNLPWGEKVFHNGDWGCESVAKVYGDDFDIAKFKMILKRD